MFSHIKSFTVNSKMKLSKKLTKFNLILFSSFTKSFIGLSSFSSSRSLIEQLKTTYK